MIYWTLKSVPELAALPRKQRRRVHERCLHRYFWGVPPTRRSLGAYFALIVTSVLVAAGGVGLLRGLGTPHNLWIMVALGYVGTTVGSFIFSRIAIPTIRPLYREFIEEYETHVR